MDRKEYSIKLVTKVMNKYGYDRPADLLADLLYFCDSEHSTDTFDEELRVAYGYLEMERLDEEQGEQLVESLLKLDVDNVDSKSG